MVPGGQGVLTESRAGVTENPLVRRVDGIPTR